MVDVTEKAESHRVAVASALVHMADATAERIRNRDFEKGDVLQIARVAGVMATKRTADLIPLCHPLRISAVEVEFQFVQSNVLQIHATVKAFDRTGVEMEALTAVTIAGLTVYDMCKSVDRTMSLSDVQLEHKLGGKSGTFSRSGQ